MTETNPSTGVLKGNIQLPTDFTQFVAQSAFTNAAVKAKLEAALVSASLSVSGIAFPGTQIPSSNPNTLDDYEEGTFQPSITFGGEAVGLSLSSQFGRYTKIGGRVFFTIRIVFSSKGTSAGNVLVTGLPFSAMNINSNYSPVSIWANFVSYSRQVDGYVSLGSSNIILESIPEAGSAKITLTDTNFINSSALIISGHYTAA